MMHLKKVLIISNFISTIIIIIIMVGINKICLDPFIFYSKL